MVLEQLRVGGGTCWRNGGIIRIAQKAATSQLMNGQEAPYLQRGDLLARQCESRSQL